MNLNKHLDFFDPISVENLEINIIGVGAVGSFVALQLIKLGVQSIKLWDFDIVEEHNLTNQIYDTKDLYKLKTEALKEHLLKINPNAEIKTYSKYTNQTLKGAIFLTVDSIELRKRIAEENMYSIMVDIVLDGRIGLDRGQVYTTVWNNPEKVQNYINLCDFKDNEVDAPVAACGTTLSVLPTVLIVASYLVAQFINYIRKQDIKQVIMIDAFDFKTKAY